MQPSRNSSSRLQQALDIEHNKARRRREVRWRLARAGSSSAVKVKCQSTAYCTFSGGFQFRMTSSVLCFTLSSSAHGGQRPAYFIRSPVGVAAPPVAVRWTQQQPTRNHSCSRVSLLLPDRCAVFALSSPDCACPTPDAWIAKRWKRINGQGSKGVQPLWLVTLVFTQTSAHVPLRLEQFQRPRPTRISPSSFQLAPSLAP